MLSSGDGVKLEWKHLLTRLCCSLQGKAKEDVEAILNYAETDKEVLYLVQYKGGEDPSWENKDHLTRCGYQTLLKEFHSVSFIVRAKYMCVGILGSPPLA